MMKNVLVIGSTGQIGSELTMKIRREIPGSTVVAGYIPGAEPKGVLLESGPAELADVRDAAGLAAIVQKYSIDTIYNLAALLSAVAEKKPLLAWDIQMNGLLNILEVAREKKCAVFTPSSIGSFGPETPHVGTPQDTIQRPRSMYGVTKVATELLSDYYFHKYGVDTRSVRFPGHPGSVIRREVAGLSHGNRTPPKDLHGPPRTLVLPDGSIIVRFAGHGTIAGATCLLDPHCVSRSPEYRIMARRSSHARSQNEST